MSAMAALRIAVRDASRNWRPLLITGLLYSLVAAAVLTPLVGLLFRYLVARSGNAALTDVDIARFLLTTGTGISAAILLGALSLAVLALQQVCLMAIGFWACHGRAARVLDGFALATSTAWPVLRLMAGLLARIVVIALPFVAVIGAAWWFFLREHDINYYLSAHPPEFWTATAIAAIALLVLAVMLARRLSGWLVALPLVAFENVEPSRALGLSEQRMAGRRKVATVTLLLLAGGMTLINLALTAGLLAGGRALAPLFSRTVPGMLLFITVFALAWLGLGLFLSILGSALLAMFVVREYVEGTPEARQLAGQFAGASAVRPPGTRASWPALLLALSAVVVAGLVIATRRFQVVSKARHVLVFAHRGASDEAPENTLAAFRLAGDRGADFIELDVQESADSVVLVGHDADLMKVARSPLRIWQTRADTLRTVDIGSYRAARFSGERVPTLAEALEVARGRTRVNIELKDYGHDMRLEQRVAELVEAAGMQDQIVTMSLSPRMVGEMKRIRPGWTAGLLLAKAIGHPAELPADFLAVESSVATRRFIAAAHAAGKPVYAWTVNDPQQMIKLMGSGIDGLITNRPEVARDAIAEFQGMNPAERLFLLVMTRLGAPEPTAPPDSLLRP